MANATHVARPPERCDLGSKRLRRTQAQPDPAGRGPPRHPARRPRRRRLDVHQRRRARPSRQRPARRLAHPDGHHPPRQAHGKPLAPHPRVRPARQPRRHRLRRLGPLPRQRLRGSAEVRRPRPPRTHRADRRLPQVHQANAGRLRPVLRQAPRRAQRQARHEDGADRADSRGHSQLQVRKQVRPPGHGLVRLDRDLHGGGTRATATSKASRRRSTPTTKRSPPRCSTPMPP